MAETESPPPTRSVVGVDEKKLKYLDFVQVATIYVIVSLSSIYEYAKCNSGPLKSSVQTVEGTVKSVIGPVYHKFHDVPFQLLKFVDRKVDELITEVDRHMPSLIKEASSHVRTVALEVKRAGIVETAANVAKTVYVKYEPVAEKYVVVAWSSLNRLPLFPQMARVLVPTTAYWAERYNQTVGYFASRGYTVSYYVPLVPIDRIAEVFKATENEHAADLSNENAADLSNGDAAGVKTQ